MRIEDIRLELFFEQISLVLELTSSISTLLKSEDFKYNHMTKRFRSGQLLNAS